jgi:hypothetical protein
MVKTHEARVEGRRGDGVVKSIKQSKLVGWREWLSLPGLGIDRIKAKIDTGALTSALHAEDIVPFDCGGEAWVSFVVKPHAGGARDRAQVFCRARARGFRDVKSSSGTVERRCVIVTPVVIAEKRFDIEVTLTNRGEMGHEMLVGRSALRKGRFLVHPSRSFVQGPMIPFVDRNKT